MATIWRFEEKFVKSCKMVLDEVLKLLNCDLSHSLFLVGVHGKTNMVTVIPDNSVGFGERTGGAARSGRRILRFLPQ